MGLKADFVNKIAEHYPGFDENGSVEIHFGGSGDSFDSFHYIEVYDGDRNFLNGQWKFTPEDEDFLFQIIDASNCEYSFNNHGTDGKILYEGKRLSVETVVGYEYYGDVDNEEENGESTATL